MSDQTSFTAEGRHSMACTVDRLATDAATSTLAAGGTAADAAVAASAVLAVTAQHMCGMGGDLFALVHQGRGMPTALTAVGRAGSGAHAADLRAEGLDRVPMRGDLRAATVPGCVDGWLALHHAHGRLPIETVLAPAIDLATNGFKPSLLLLFLVEDVLGLPDAEDYRTENRAAGDLIRRPLVAQVLQDIAAGGRDAFYDGAFGAGLVALGDGIFRAEDLESNNATWVDPVSIEAFGETIWTVPPPSQGYLALAGAWVADRLPLPENPDDPRWTHLLSEAARSVGRDRPEMLSEHADPEVLLAPERLQAQRDAIDPTIRSVHSAATGDGGTIYLCVADGEGMAVSLIQSNAADWGCHVVVPGTGIFLHNRGIGFSLDPGHPAELAPGRKPPHTLSPLIVTRPDGSLRALLGTMGGDIQPQILLQLLTRLLRHGQAPGDAIAAPRWMLGRRPFQIWEGDDAETTQLEHGFPGPVSSALTRLGHDIVEAPPWTNFGHAHAIVANDDGTFSGAADPRSIAGSAQGN